jgi:hypothetical protein
VGREGDVVVHAEHVGETEVDEFDLVFLDQVEHVVGGGHGATSTWMDERDEADGARLVPAGEPVAPQGVAGFRGASGQSEGFMLVQLIKCIAPSWNIRPWPGHPAQPS